MKSEYVRYLLVGGMAATLLASAYFATPCIKPTHYSIENARKVNGYIKEHGFEKLNYFLDSGGVQQKNICGDEGPESFIELGGIKYYSRIDDKDISDLVCKSIDSE